MNGIMIRKNAVGETVTVTYGRFPNEHITDIKMDDVTHYNKSRFYTALITWALDGYRGNPPILNK